MVSMDQRIATAKERLHRQKITGFKRPEPKETQLVFACSLKHISTDNKHCHKMDPGRCYLEQSYE